MACCSSVRFIERRSPPSLRNCFIREANGRSHGRQVSQFRPAVALEAIELRHRIAALERDRTRRLCFRSLRSCWFDPALTLVVICKATRGRGVKRSARRAVHRSAQEIVSAESCRCATGGRSAGGSLLLTARLGRGDSNSKPSSHVRRHLDSEHQPGERREPERSEAGPNPGRTNSLQYGCSYLRV